MTHYSQRVFRATRPAQLREGDWRSDSEFLQSLKVSWQRQYADYIGEQSASAYIAQLQSEEQLFDHHDPMTLHAWVDERIVAVSALRPMAGLNLITMLEVLPDYRGKGIGKQLVRAHCTISEALMAHVSIHQPRVKAFYTALGFHVLQRETQHHGEHELEFDVLARRNTMR